MTLIEIENSSNGIVETVVGETNAMPAKTNANIPRPIFVKLNFFVRLNASFDWDEFAPKRINIQPVTTLSTPIVSSTIESNVIIVDNCSVGKPSKIAMTDKIRDIVPTPICKERNHLGGLSFLLVSCNVDVEYLLVFNPYLFSHLSAITSFTYLVTYLLSYLILSCTISMMKRILLEIAYIQGVSVQT
jgi:hypothetical protein